MAAWQKMGMICINSELEEVCQQCLWLEWSPTHHACLNEKAYFCHKKPDWRPEPEHARRAEAAPPPLSSPKSTT